MSFTESPAVETLEVKRIGFVGADEQRGASNAKDQLFMNFLAEKIEHPDRQGVKYWVRTRPGLSTVYTLGTGVGRGIYYWNYGTGYVFSIVGNTVYSNTAVLGTLNTSTGACGFTEFLDSTGTRKLILLDGTDCWVFTSGTAMGTRVTDVNFPTPHIPQPVFIDGYLFVAKANRQDIYNSNLNDPTTWNSSQYISAEIYPDLVMGLTKNNNYLIAIGQYSAEWFYDAGNATGSPMARYPSAVQQFGVEATNTVVQTDKEIICVGQTQDGSRTVWSVDGFKEKDISIPSVRYALDAEGANITTASAMALRVCGQKLYAIFLASGRILVYSFDTQLWHEWSFTNVPTDVTNSPVGAPYMLVSNGTTMVVAKFDETIYTDFGIAPTGVLQTSCMDFSTSRRKRMDEMIVVGDAPNGTNNVPATIQWSDDDYNTWSTGVTMNINPYRSRITRLGMFRRRALKLTYNQPYPLRMEGMEFQINKGQS